MGLRHIVAQEALILEQTRELTNGEWYQNQLAPVTLQTAAQTLSVSFPALMTRFALRLELGRHYERIQAESHAGEETDRNTRNHLSIKC